MQLSNRFSVLEDLPKPLNEQTSINDLPIELLEEIFRWAKLPEPLPTLPSTFGADYEGNPNYVSPNERFPLFKTLRQVCSKWHDLATPKLFRDVVLLSHVGSWYSLNKIATTPWLAQHVRKIQLATIRHLSVYENFKDYCHHEYNMIEDRRFKYPGPNGGPLSLLPSDDPRSSYPRYRKWMAAEQKMSVHWQRGTTPPLKLHLLTALQQVETVGHHALAVVKRVYNYRTNRHWLGPWREYNNGTPREFITGCIDEVSRGSDISPNHLDLFLKAAQKSSLKLDTLHIRNSQELLLSTHKISFHGLRRLELHLGGYEWDVPFRDRYPLSAWVSGLRKLEELSVVTTYSYPVFRLLAEAPWPNLRVVELRCGNLLGRHLSGLLDFVGRHRRSLQALRLKGAFRESMVEGEIEELGLDPGHFVQALRKVVGRGFKRLEIPGAEGLDELEMLRGWVVIGDGLEPDWG